LLNEWARALRRPGYVLPAYFLLAIAVRLLGLSTTPTADEAYWVQRSVRFGAALARGDLDSTYRSGHPGVTVMWLGLVGIGRNQLAPFLAPKYVDVQAVELAPRYREVLTLARRAMLVAVAALLAAGIGLVWKLCGRGPALLGGTLLLLDPYLVGMTRLLHPDALLAPLMAVALLAALVFWTGRGGWRYLVLSAVMTGLAVLTKTPAVVLVPCFGFCGLVACWEQRAWRTWLHAGLAWSVGAALVVVVCWPALWLQPVARVLDVIAFVQAEGAQPHLWPNYFLGQPLSNDPGPLYYPIALLVRLGPVPLAGLAALGLLVWRRRLPLAVLGLGAFTLLFIGLMTIGAKKLDRYLLPALLVLDLLAAIGLWHLIRTRITARARLASIGLVVVVQAVVFGRASPDFIAAYNPLLGGVHGATQLVLVGWGEGLDQTAKYLNARPDAERLVVTTHYHDVLRPLFRGKTVRMAEPARLDYCVVYINMLQRDLIPPVVRAAMVFEPPEFTAYVQGEPYAWVYRVPAHLQETLPTTPSDEGAFGDEHD
jgi:hypothetical protein